MTKEALKLALEALESMKETLAEHDEPTTFNEDQAITAIQLALALNKKAENARELDAYKVTVVDDRHPKGVPLEQWGRVATPPAAQPAPVQLTDEQIAHLWETRVSQPCPSYPLEKSDWVQFARAIEAAHNIKEQP